MQSLKKVSICEPVLKHLLHWDGLITAWSVKMSSLFINTISSYDFLNEGIDWLKWSNLILNMWEDLFLSSPGSSRWAWWTFFIHHESLLCSLECWVRSWWEEVDADKAFISHPPSWMNYWSLVSVASLVLKSMIF